MNKKIKIATSEETIRKIVEEDCSIARFGDGELSFILENKGIYFQDCSDNISNRLKEILNSNEEKLLIGLPLALNPEFAEKEYTEFPKKYWLEWVNKNDESLCKLLDENKQYYSTQISRFYHDYVDKSNVGAYVKKLKQIWENRDVVIIEGEKSRLGVGNDLLDGAKSIQRILRTCRKCF